ncbi:homing endonuclease [Vibrio phage TCU_VP02_YC]|uniref:Phage-associated homing endonuclease n=1 Tax=Vibrio phage phi-pp2 TaxID=1204514 RepID=I6X2N8_9CAUD|nr:phage-associated homing endonuclease [Vibrio phage phi-pp2]
MNYLKIYEQLVDKRKNEIPCGYSEVHHIIPRCMGGSDDESNLIRLTAREHFIAHVLLSKAYPDNIRLKHASMMMHVSHNDKRYKSSLYYEIAKNAVSESMTINNPMHNKRNISKMVHTKRQRGQYSKFGNSEEQRARTSARMKESNPMSGKSPWEHSRATEKTIEQWSRAPQYYEWWVENQRSYAAMASAFGEKFNSVHINMYKRFVNGWNPTQDIKWVEYFV